MDWTDIIRYGIRKGYYFGCQKSENEEKLVRKIHDELLFHVFNDNPEYVFEHLKAVHAICAFHDDNKELLNFIVEVAKSIKKGMK
ncbi:MAG: hypothetical protein J6N21_11525 [Butyrivibrio sp.]|nr:hypothetical protein [Butyrivibrio sp.]